MTSCDKRRCWDGDGGRPGGKINSCDSYVGEYSSRGGGEELHTNKRQSLRLEQYLTEAWNSTTSQFCHIAQSGDQLAHKYTHTHTHSWLDVASLNILSSHILLDSLGGCNIFISLFVIISIKKVSLQVFKFAFKFCITAEIIVSLIYFYVLFIMPTSFLSACCWLVGGFDYKIKIMLK